MVLLSSVLLSYLLVSISVQASKLSRIGELLKALQTPGEGSTSQIKTVSFAESSVRGDAASGVTTDERRERREAASPEPSLAVVFLSPAIGAVGAACVATICDTRSLEHSKLLSSILSLRGGEKTVSSIVVLLEREHPLLVRKGTSLPTGQDSEESKLVFLCSSLVRAIRLEDLVVSTQDDRVQLAESVIESVVCLLFDELVGVTTAELFLGRIVQVLCVKHCL